MGRSRFSIPLILCKRIGIKNQPQNVDTLTEKNNDFRHVNFPDHNLFHKNMFSMSTPCNKRMNRNIFPHVPTARALNRDPFSHMFEAEDIRYHTGFIQYTSPHSKLMKINSTFLLLKYHSYITRQLRGTKTETLIREQKFVIHFRPPRIHKVPDLESVMGVWWGGGERKSCRVSFRVLHRVSKHPKFDHDNFYKFFKIDCFLLSYSKIVIWRKQYFNTK